MSQAKEVCRSNSLDMLFLSETKNGVVVIEKVRRKLGFDKVVWVDPVGIAGGMALFWKGSVQVKQVLKTTCSIEVEVEDDVTGKCWWVICIYLSTVLRVRKAEWQFLSDRRLVWGDSWVMVGDYNDIVGNQEKWGGRWRGDWTFRDFREFIHSNGMIDLSFEGVPWTWWMRRYDGSEIKERLDRALCSEQWFFEFPKARVNHIVTEASDHCCLVLDTDPAPVRMQRRFHFDQKWLKSNEVRPVVEKAWRRDQQGSEAFRIVGRIRECQKDLRDWNRKTYVNASKEIKKWKAKIQQGESKDPKVIKK